MYIVFYILSTQWVTVLPFIYRKFDNIQSNEKSINVGLRESDVAQTTAEQALLTLKDNSVGDATGTGVELKLVPYPQLPVHISSVIDRQYPIATGEWLQTHRQDDILGVWTFPDALYIHYLRDVIKVFHAIRFRVKVTVQFNMPVHACGQLMITTSPYGTMGLDPAKYHVGYSGSMWNHVLPTGVTNETTTLNIPFIYPNPVFYTTEWQQTARQLAKVVLSVCTPLQNVQCGTQGVLKVPYTVWAAMTDVELYAPTGYNVIPNIAVPQMDDVAEHNRRVRALEKQQEMDDFYSEANGYYDDDTGGNYSSDDDVDVVEPQTGDSELQEVKAKEVDPANDKPKTDGKAGTLDKIMGVAKVVGGVAKAVDIVCNPLKAVTKLFGLSRPTDQRVPRPITFSLTKGSHHCNSVDTAEKLVFHSNSQQDMAVSLTGDSGDSMSFASIVQTPCLVQRFACLTDDTSFSHTIPVTPNFCHKITDSSSTAHIQPTYTWMVTSQHAFFSGSIKYSITLITTPFHTGRLRIRFFPNQKLANTSLPLEYPLDCMTQIIDVSTQTRVEFTIPHMWHQMYSIIDDNFAETSYGFLLFDWLNTVTTSNSDTPTEVWFLVYQACDDDFSVRMPRRVNYVPYEGPIDPQFNPRDSFRKRFQPFHKSLKTRIEKNLLFGGDEIRSIRDLILPYTRLGQSFTTLTGGSHHIDFAVEMTSSNLAVSLDTDIPSLTASRGYIEHFLRMYCFWRGSYRVKVVTQSKQPIVMEASYFTPFPPLQVQPTNPPVIAQTNFKPEISFQIPYNTTRLISSTNFEEFPKPSAKLLIYTLSDDPVGLFVYAAVGDDFVAGGFRPPSRLVVNM